VPLTQAQLNRSRTVLEGSVEAGES
jgi:hypothetical protein